MPGASYFEAPACGASLSGVHPGIFRPPASPSISSSTYLGRSTGSLYSDISTPGPNSKRKRRKARDSITPFNDWAMAGDSSLAAYGMADHKVDAGSRRGGNERRYILAGHIETPSGPAQRGPADMDESIYSEVDYRRALGSKRPCAEYASSQFRYPAAHPPPETRTPQSSSWSFFSINVLGGVVGKVWEFCTAGAFRGFYAGGGKGYDVQGMPTAPPLLNGQVWCNEHDIPTLPEYDSSAPFGFPEPDYSPFYERETPDSTPPPAAKRRLIHDGASGDDLRRNWVMVSEPTNKRRQSVSSRLSATRPSQRSKLATSHARRISKPVSRLSASSFSMHSPHGTGHVGSTPPINREPASFASPRSPARPHASHSPSRLPIPSRPQSSGNFSPTQVLRPQLSRISSPTPYSRQGRQRTNSTASAAATVPLGTYTKARIREPPMQDMQEGTPRLDAEAQSLAARRMQDEMTADLRINSFNARLRDMIRQGREALGTTIEVELDNDDGGDAGVMDMWEDE